jgi:hypothetical protein
VNVGFTGSRAGLTAEQGLTVTAMLLALGPGFFHFGDCKGADDRAARIAYELGWWVVAHPGPAGKDAGRWRTLGSQPRVSVLDERPFLERNELIAIAGDFLLIACPSGLEAEQRRSGTWATVRDARKLERRIVLVQPDGRAVDDMANREAITLAEVSA